MNRLLIDECLSASLVAVAKERGVAADFGPHIGLGGWQDWNIVRFDYENGYTVVTNNRRDFLREYLKYEIHYGLIVVVPYVERAQQVDLFARVLDHLIERDTPPDGELIEILADRVVHVRSWTVHEHDIGHIAKPVWSQIRTEGR